MLRPVTIADPSLDVYADTGWADIEAPDWLRDDPEGDEVNTGALDTYFAEHYGSAFVTDDPRYLTPQPRGQWG